MSESRENPLASAHAPSAPPRLPALRRRVPVPVVAALWALVTIPVFGWLAGQDLLDGPVWRLVLLVALVGVLATDPVQRLLGGGTTAGRPLLRILVSVGVLTILTADAGWTALLPAAALSNAVSIVQVTGSRTWRTTAVVVAGFTVLAQVLVAVDVVPSVVVAERGHLAAGWGLVLALLTLGAVGRSVADQERSQDSLARTEARLRALMDSSTDVLSVTDESLRLTYVSPAVERALGHDARTLLGTSLLELADVGHRASVARQLAHVVRTGPGTRSSADVLVVLASGERRWFEWNLHNLLDDPLVGGLVVDQRDVTERLLHSEALAHAAAHDDLTGLPNRREIMRRLATLTGRAGPGAGVGVLFVDLDRFKEVNDTYGHAIGDEVLVVVAQRLASVLRTHDHLARLGGDEFLAVLTEVTDEAQVQAITERLEHAVAQPVSIAGTVITVRASIGAVLATDGTTDPASLFARSDGAMYDVKRRRKSVRPHSGPGRPGSDADRDQAAS